ncbi:MAG: WG repeat-containing protein, partial [Saprospirales bacterium]|nr:WG repeat-containing protein [Saprospirales bacterium]
MNKTENGAFIDINQKVVIPKKYDYINHFSEGLACVKLDNKWHVIN